MDVSEETMVYALQHYYSPASRQKLEEALSGRGQELTELDYAVFASVMGMADQIDVQGDSLNPSYNPTFLEVAELVLKVSARSPNLPGGHSNNNAPQSNV